MSGYCSDVWREIEREKRKSKKEIQFAEDWGR